MTAKKGIFIALLISLFVLGNMALADDLVMFNYQGRVRVQGTAFTGTGYFKFAIVSNDGAVTLWSNDGTSADGSEPDVAVAVQVTDGIFDVMIGDPDLGMQPINRSIFNHPSGIKLRIWFSDGTHGFQRLLPDRRIVNPHLIGLVSGTEDFTIYVNGTTGNDDNNGLTTDTAKQTIQAAVDVLPERLRCNVTIDIADGIYREEVKVYGISVEPTKKLTFLGDETWTPSSPGDPTVRITGTDNDTYTTPVRDCGFVAENCTGIYIQGFLLDYYANAGFYLKSGIYEVANCKASYNNARGFLTRYSARLDITNCISDYNGDGFQFCSASDVGAWNLTALHNNRWGITLEDHATVDLWDCVSKFNSGHGVGIGPVCYANICNTSDFSNNGNNGMRVDMHSVVNFYYCSGHMDYNTNFGLFISGDSTAYYHTYNTFIGNGAGSVYYQYGGHAYP